MRTDLWTARLRRDVPQKGGTSLESASQARRLKPPSTSTSILIPNSETKLRKGPASVATVMTDVFEKNEINLLRKFAKIVRIFDKVDDSKNQGVI